MKSLGSLNLPGDSVFNFESLDVLWVAIRYPCQKLGGLNSLGDSVFIFEILDMLWAVIGCPSQILWPFAFARSIRFQFRASRYIMALNRKFE